MTPEERRQALEEWARTLDEVMARHNSLVHEVVALRAEQSERDDVLTALCQTVLTLEAGTEGGDAARDDLRQHLARLAERVREVEGRPVPGLGLPLPGSGLLGGLGGLIPPAGNPGEAQP